MNSAEKQEDSLLRVLRYSSFTGDPATGNPAGVVLDASGIDSKSRQELAARVGYSETAFAEPLGQNQWKLSYFSPEREVPFCGHATLATAVALAEAEGTGTIAFHTLAGTIPVTTERRSDGIYARIDAPTGHSSPATPDQLEKLLAQLHWRRDDLDEDLPAHIANAGNNHFVVAANSRARLARLEYDFDGLKKLMQAEDWISIQAIWKESDDLYHSRNPFPVGGVVEDPATGAAAAAFGYYLHELGKIPQPRKISIVQGEDMGRRSLIEVDVTPEPKVTISGTAVRIPFT